MRRAERWIVAMLTLMVSVGGFTVVGIVSAPPAAAKAVTPSKIAVIELENTSWESAFCTGSGTSSEGTVRSSGSYPSADAGALTPICSSAGTHNAEMPYLNWLAGRTFAYTPWDYFESNVKCGGWSPTEGYTDTFTTANPATGGNIDCPDFIGSTTIAGDASAQNYALQYSADNCGSGGNSNVGCVDGYYNVGTNTPLQGPDPSKFNSTNNTSACPTGITTCFPNLFGQSDAYGTHWHMYAEDWPGTSATTNCTKVAFSDGSTKLEYARKHAPGVFWTDSASDCAATPSTVTHLPQGSDTGTDSALPVGFNGTESFSTTNLIVPELCHDAHSYPTGTQPTGCEGTNTSTSVSNCGDVGGHNSGTHTSMTETTATYPSGGPAGSKHTLADYWLCQNLGGIERDVGTKGAVVIVFDEDSSNTGRVPAVVLPGDTSDTSQACGGVAGSGACPLVINDGNDSTLTLNHKTAVYDQVSLFRAQVLAVAKTSAQPHFLWSTAKGKGACTYYDPDVISSANCARVSSSTMGLGTGDINPDTSQVLPLKVSDSPTPAIVQTATGTAHVSTSVTATFSAASTAGSLLVAVLADNQGPVITPPSGWQLADQSMTAESVYYDPNAASTTSVTFSFDRSVSSVLQTFEVSQLAGDYDTSANASSGGSNGTVADSGTTDILDSNGDQLVIGGWMNLGDTDAFTLDSGSTPGFTMLATVYQGGVIGQSVFYQLNAPEQAYDAKGDLASGSEWRATIAAFD